MARQDELALRWDELDLQTCYEALVGAPERAAPPAHTLIGVGASTTLTDFLMPHLHAVVAELDAIPTRDPDLRAGRAGWRAFVRAYAAFPRVEDPCGQLERWRDAEWPRSSEPQVPEYDAAAIDARGVRAWFMLRRAARRLRGYGISPAAAQRFTGATLLDGLPTPSDADAGFVDPVFAGR